MAVKVVIGTRIPEPWVTEIDALIASKFPHRTRSEWLLGVIEHELISERSGRNPDAQIDELLSVVPLVREIHRAIVPKGAGRVND